MHPRREAWLLSVLFAAGCAGQVVRPPTPARDMDNVALLAAGKAENEHYYILIFGSQRTPRTPRYTHTWATIVRTTEPPNCPPRVVEVATISWLPATLDIRPIQLRVEEGVNLDLSGTLAEVLRHGERVSLWGPYETWNGAYQRFMTQKAFIDSGVVGYQCTDGFGEAARRGNGCNCFHSITDMDPEFDRRQYPLLWYGNAASENIVRQLFERPILIHPRQTHDWLVPALGLDRCPIVRRQYDGPAKEFSPEAIMERAANPPKARRRLLP